MRRIVLPLAMLAALGVAGCNSQQSGSNSGQATKSQATKVTGTVSVTGSHTPSANATLDIKLVDASVESAQPLASKTMHSVTQLPVNFTLNFNPKKVNAHDLYVVQARITDGERVYTMPVQAPVLTKGAPDHVKIQLNPQPTPSENMMSDYRKLKGQLGAMKQTQHTKLENKNTSLAWQVFREKALKDHKGPVRYIIELIDSGKKGFVHNAFAYKNGKPWVVVQEHKANQNAKSSETERAGWNEKGDLVVKDDIKGGKTSTLSDKQAAELRKQAEAMYKRVGGR